MPSQIPDQPISILGINGSPRKNGKTAMLLQQLLSVAKKHGGATQLIHLADYEIKPCAGCYSNNPKDCVYPCRQKDGMQKIYPVIEKADALVLGSPVYWFNVSGLMKNFIDRLSCAENAYFLYEGKLAVLAVSCEESGALSALMNMAAPLNQMGFVLMPYMIYAPAQWLPATIDVVGANLITVAAALKKIKWEDNTAKNYPEVIKAYCPLKPAEAEK